MCFDNVIIMLDTFVVQDIGVQLSSFVRAVMETHADCRDVVAAAGGLFPIDIDLEQVYFYNHIIITDTVNYPDNH